MIHLSYYLLLFFFYSLPRPIASQIQLSLCSQGCLVCSPTSMRCTACGEGYQLTEAGRCLKTDGSYNCDIFLGNSYQCLKCKATFRMVNGTCFKDFSGCLQYQNNNCLLCGYGTVLSNGRCSGVLNCKSYEPECKYCESGYILNSNRCFYVQRDCVRVHVQSGACQTCANGFNLVAFTCLNGSAQVPNCNLYNQSACLMCKPGFSLKNNSCVPVPICTGLQFVNKDFKCESLPVGCKQINITSKSCLSCFPNYQKLNQSCEPSLPPNCLKLSHIGQCISCQDRFYPDKLECRAVSRYCSTYSSNGRCINCIFPYFINYGGICQDPFCLNSTLDSCHSCKQLYRYDNRTGRCMINDPRCVNASDTVCYNCSSGYYASSNVCLELPQNCLSADTKGACLKCRDNYFQQLDQCYVIEQNIKQCVRYDQYSYVPRCLMCEAGYFVTLGKCKQISAFCSLLLSDGNCAMCVQGFKLANGKCESITGQNADKNCVQRNKNQCVRCASGYALGVNSICYPLSSKCKSYDLADICRQCLDGQVLSRGACLLISLIDINCKVYVGVLCRQCYAGYYLQTNACKLPNTDCKQYDPNNGGCTACFPGYTLTNRQCIVIKKVQNCLAYDRKGDCLRCAKFFYLSSLKCVRVNPLCRSYEELTGACRSCYGGFELQQGNCIQKSMTSYFDAALNQVVRVDTCKQYGNQTGRCTICISGYFLQDGKCINIASLSEVDHNCKLYRNLTYCQECFSGFIALAGQCKGVDPLCRTADQSTGVCTSCYQGYILEAGNCFFQSAQRIEPCLQKKADYTCFQCSVGYILSSGKCIFNHSQSNSYNIPFCQIAANESFCLLCSNGFYARNGACYQVSSSCQTYDPQNGQCLTCKDTYIFSQGVCIFPALGIDPRCLSYLGVYCSKCASGYYLSNYICKQIDHRCVEFNFQVNQCLSCSSGVPLFDTCE